MRVALLEHFTSLPAKGVDRGLVREGRAIRDAVGKDLRRLPGVDLRVVKRQWAFSAALDSCEAALVIAPEQEDTLERLCLKVERAGRLLVGPSSRMVRRASDKLWTARRLQDASVPTPRTGLVRFSEALEHLRAHTPPFVLKPREGCGGRGVVIVRRKRDLAPAIDVVRRATSLSAFLVQEYIEGPATSVSLLAGESLLDLGLNRQLHGPRPTLEYLGGETFWPHRQALQARAAARAAVEALSPTGAPPCGHLGVDLVLGPDGPVVIEINPRLTTSYIGLRRSIRENLAGLLLQAAQGNPLPGRITRTARCLFRADGVTRLVRPVRRERCPTRSAGTSAASI